MSADSGAIHFVTDGRTYEPSGKREGEFVVAFGTLVDGPTRPEPGTLVTPFLAEVLRPSDTEPLLYQAHCPRVLESPHANPQDRTLSKVGRVVRGVSIAREPPVRCPDREETVGDRGGREAVRSVLHRCAQGLVFEHMFDTIGA